MPPLDLVGGCGGKPPSRQRNQALSRRGRNNPQWALDDSLTVVLFAGLGGACDGLEEAGCPVNVANNHDAVALAAHAALHPHTTHIKGDIFDVDPVIATGGRRVKILWASPDCRDHSVAKGGAPRSARVRSLPWQVCRWAAKTHPAVVFVENVREIRGWGPLIAKRDPTTGRVMKLDGSTAAKGERVPLRDQQLVRDKARTGRIFRRWKAHMQGLGYAYEDQDLNAADYGVPTSRRRFFAVMRSDGRPIHWPDRTHAPRNEAGALGLRPWVAAASIIDWSLPLPSIFGRKKPLAEATHRRIAAGLKRYVLESGDPFLLPITHSGAPRVHGIDEPLRTITTAHRGEIALVAPHVTKFRAGSVGADVLDFCPTITANGHSKRLGAAIPIGVVAAWMAQHNTGVVGHELDEPVSTLTTSGTHQQLSAAFLAKLRGTSTAADATDPVPTLSAGGNHVAAVAAFLTKYYGTGGQTQGAGEPLHTLSTKARFGVVTVNIKGEPFIITDIGMRMLEPHEAAAAHELDLPARITVDGVTRSLTKTESMRLVGNSVPKRMARLLAEANAAHTLYAPSMAGIAAE